jgi:uncharacterized protein YjhX (UPF0386 family)
MALSQETMQILHALVQGASLKVHRTLEGAKVHKLHPLQGAAIQVKATTVRNLERRGWLRSNMKFPVATYLLTEKGSEVALQLSKQHAHC